MADFEETWDEDAPTDDTNANTIDNEMRSCRKGIKERLQPNMFFDENITMGQHNSDGNFKKLPISNSDPPVAGVADAIILFAKDVNGKVALHAMTEDDEEVRILHDGHLDCGIVAADATTRTLTPGSGAWASEDNLSITITGKTGEIYEARMLANLKSSTTGRVKIAKTAGAGAADTIWGDCSIFGFTISPSGYITYTTEYYSSIVQYFEFTGDGEATFKLQAYTNYTYTIKDRTFFMRRIL